MMDMFPYLIWFDSIWFVWNIILKPEMNMNYIPMVRISSRIFSSIKCVSKEQMKRLKCSYYKNHTEISETSVKKKVLCYRLNERKKET